MRNHKQVNNLCKRLEIQKDEDSRKEMGSPEDYVLVQSEADRIVELNPYAHAIDDLRLDARSHKSSLQGFVIKNSTCQYL